ncbi:MAG: hypothetical protein ACKO0Z_11050 [Betaproteobacteria bacterium]
MACHYQASEYRAGFRGESFQISAGAGASGAALGWCAGGRRQGQRQFVKAGAHELVAVAACLCARVSTVQLGLVKTGAWIPARTGAVPATVATGI